MESDIKDFERKRNRCSKLPSNASAEDKSRAHKIRMKAKKLLRQHDHETYRDGRYILANISQNHKYFGDTPAEHEARKESEKSS